MAVKTHHAAAGAQLKGTGADADAGAGELGIVHLTGHKAAPDQVVQTLGIGLHAGQIVGFQAYIRGADGFVRFLSAFFAAVQARLRRQVSFTQVFINVLAHRIQRILAQVGGVGTHVGDVTGFVQALRQGHGFFHAEAQPCTGGLL